MKTDKASPAGNHANLFCQVVVTQNGEPIVHNIGTGHAADRRPPAAQGRPPRRPRPPSPPPRPSRAAPAAKPLGRLEKLRLESKQATKAVRWRSEHGKSIPIKDPTAMSRPTVPIDAPS